MPETWTTFFPDHIVNCASGFLEGIVDDQRCVVYVFAVSGNTAYSEYDIDRIIGTWQRHDDATGSQQHHDYECDKSFKANFPEKAASLHISQSSKGVMKCDVFEKRKMNVTEKCAVLVIFNQRALLASFLLRETAIELHNELHDHVRRIVRVYNSHQELVSPGLSESSLAYSKASAVRQIFSQLLKMMTFSFFSLEKCLLVVSFEYFLKRLPLQPPEFVNHISNKLSRFRQIQSTNMGPKGNLVLFDTCGQQLLDSFLGVIVMAFVINRGCADDIANFIAYWVDVTASYLNDLLHWLMGAPAGLKLNAQLAGYMGHFFLYHVYLWTGYLSLLQPALGWLMWCAACMGIFGISSQLCVAQDILSMLTIHIYCFYVYAARIHSLQLYALSSLWRLFRGKKWNVLRLRVDSATYNIDQLFVGTLMFTVLLFLLPTTALYYFVFATLRLFVLLFRGMMSWCVHHLNNVPVCTLLLWILHSKAVAGDVKFTVLEDRCSSNCLVLSMQTVHLPIYSLYKKGEDQMKWKQNQQYSWSELLKRLAQGNLIYPWIAQEKTPVKKKSS